MTQSPLPFGGSKRGAGTPLERARGLAELAFASSSHVADVNRGRHLALLHVDTLQLDLADPAQRCFDDYELLELLGEGGMGVVYRARQVSLDREVAIKLLSAGPWASRDFIARFEREAQNAARMQHPNIVAIHEVGSFEGLQFFSMQLVRGESLSSRMRHGMKFTPCAAAMLMSTVAEAVDYAHRLGMLHLDLKPANVLLDEAGVPYVADFGLARRLENALAVENDEVSGTPAYMAPEQAQVRAHKLTAATDIWGLGAILYELLTGRPPFRAETARDTVNLVLQGQVRAPRRWQPSLPLDLQAIVLRCLNRDPAERYPSARALADDLARFVEGRPVQARPLNAMQRVSRWAGREPKLAATGLLAFAILLAGLVATTHQWRRAEASAGAARDNLWASRAQTAQRALLEGDGFRGLRPLAANLVEMEAAGNARRAAIERQRIGTILANAPRPAGFVRVPAGQAISSVAIAPDGRHFALATFDSKWGPQRFVRQYDMQTQRETWSTSTRGRTFLMAYGDAGVPHGGLHYSADGRFLLVSLIEQPVVPAPRYSDMIAIDARDGRVLEPKGLTEPHADIVYDDALRYALVRFRSDSSLRWPDSAQFYEVDGWKPAGPRHRVGTTLAADLWLPAPDGSVWFGTRDSTNLALYDVPSLKPRWQLRLRSASLVRAWQFSHDGRWLALGSVDGAVRLVAVGSGVAVNLGSGPSARVVRVEFAEDDRTLAAVDENGQLWTWDVATRMPRSAPLHFARNDGAAAVRFAGDTLFGGGFSESGASQVAYVTLAPHAPFNNEAVPGAARVHGLTAFGMAFDVSTSAGRLVTTVRDDIVGLWRLPPSPLRWAKAAPLLPPVQNFDGSRLMTVDGATVRVVDVASGIPVSPPLRHPEPVAFAELAPDGTSLVTIAGRTVRVIDARTWRLRGAPVVLPQAPQRVALAQGAPVLVVTTNDYDGGERHEMVHRIDLDRGARIGKPVQVDAFQDFRIDPWGRHALVATWSRTRPTQFLWIALDSGVATCAPRVSFVEGIVLGADGRSAWYGVDADESRMALRHWDLETCRELPVAGQAYLRQTAVLVAHGNGLVAQHGGNEALISIDADGRQTSAVGGPIAETMHDFALSADGERAAIATRNAVHLLDARGGQRLSAPLTAPIAGDDAIAKLAFSPDGTRLLARTVNHRWLFWELPRATAESPALARLARVIDPDAPLAGGDLDAMRAPPAIIATPPRAPASGTPVEFPPAPGAGVDPRYVPLDLAAAINVPLVGVTWPEPGAAGDQPMLAPGIHRLLGVDYRIDGGVQLSGGGTAVALYPEHRRSSVVAVDGVVARRVHVLAFMHIPMGKDVPSRNFAHVVLIGADGRETRLDIRTVRDVVTSYTGPKSIPAGPRVALFGAASRELRGGGDPMQRMGAVFAVSLAVPAGTGPIRGLRFDVADGPMEAPLLYAATLERAGDGAARGTTP
jgi:hypothetical protein